MAVINTADKADRAACPQVSTLTRDWRRIRTPDHALVLIHITCPTSAPDVEMSPPSSKAAFPGPSRLGGGAGGLRAGVAARWAPVRLRPFPDSILAPGLPPPCPPCSFPPRHFSLPDVLYAFSPHSAAVGVPHRNASPVGTGTSFLILSPGNRAQHFPLVLPSCQTPCCAV